MNWDLKKVGKDINKTLKVEKVPLKKRRKYVRRLQQHIHSPFLFVKLSLPQFSYHHTTKLRACFLAVLTSWKLREIMKVFLLQVIPGQLLILWRCKAFKTASLCSHSLAVADHVAKLHEYLSWFHSRGGPNITAAASTSTPKNAGKKPGQKSRIRRTGAIASSRNDDSYADRRPYVETASVENEQRYHLKWLDKTTARVCYGCGGKLRPSDSSVPPPPFDVVV